MVEEIDVREALGLEEAEDALRLGREVREGIGGSGVSAEEVRREQRAEGDLADAASGLAEEGAAGEVVEAVLEGGHGEVSQ